VTFSANLTGSLDVFTDAFGVKAETETIFALEVDGTPVLSFFKLLSIGPMSLDHFSISDSVRLEPATLTLLFGAPSFLFVSVDSESEVINVPEPSTITLMLAGLVALARLVKRTH